MAYLTLDAGGAVGEGALGTGPARVSQILKVFLKCIDFFFNGASP